MSIRHVSKVPRAVVHVWIVTTGAPGNVGNVFQQEIRTRGNAPLFFTHGGTKDSARGKFFKFVEHRVPGEEEGSDIHQPASAPASMCSSLATAERHALYTEEVRTTGPTACLLVLSRPVLCLFDPARTNGPRICARTIPSVPLSQRPVLFWHAHASSLRWHGSVPL